MSKRTLPEINAGSMADIAFLLLIFFLVTTTMDADSGILRKIPEKQKIIEEIRIKEKNILEVNINLKNELMVEGNSIPLEELKQIAIDFIDNGGGLDKNMNRCSWCEGSKNPSSSDHPTKAFISIKADRTANYETYIAVLDNLNAAYSSLRNKLSVKLYKKSYDRLLEEYKKLNDKDTIIVKKMKLIRQKYPLLLSDVEIKN